MENDKIFELMTKMYAEMQEGFKQSNKRFDKLESDVNTLKSDVKKMDIKLEELDKKVDLSLEGHKTNIEQLTRIEKEVSKHEEIILRRVK